MSARVAAGLWLLSGVASVLTAAVAGHVGANPAPYWDQWGYVDPVVYLSEPLGRHNEHPILIGRALFWIDYAAFDASGAFLRASVLAMFALIAGSIVALARIGGIRRPAHLAILAGASVTPVFNAQAWENIVWGFQASYVPVFALTAVGAAALAAHLKRGGAVGLAIAAGCALLAPLSLANGLLTSGLLVAMALLGGARARAWLVILGAGAAAAGLLAFTDEPGSARMLPAFAQIPELVLYALRYLGGGFARAVSYLDKIDGQLFIDTMRLSPWLGAPLAALGGGGVLFVLIKRRADPAQLGLAAIIAFCGLTAAATAFARVDFPPDQALSPRYGLTGFVLAAAILGLAALNLGALRDRFPRLSVVGLALLGGLAFLGPISAAPLLKDLSGQQRGWTGAATALITGVADSQQIATTAFNEPMARDGSNLLKAAGKWHFGSVWSQRMGESVSVDADLPACQGSIEVAHVEPASAFLRIEGALNGAEARRAAQIVVLDATGRMRGFGLTQPIAGDVLHFGAPEPRPWVGHVSLSGAQGPFVAYLGAEGALRCRLGAVMNGPP